MTLHIYHVFHTGANRHYYSKVLNVLDENEEYDVKVTKVKLNQFTHVPNNVGVLTYQTFPDESQPSKFNPKLVYEKDKIFQDFKGFKILVCTHDSGDCDSFSRFPDSKSFPRIKCFPSIWFMENYNVILLSTFSTSTNEKVFPDKYPRDIKISCKFGKRDYGHKIRPCVEETLRRNFPDIVDYEWTKGKKEYLMELQRVLITVGAPGWGGHNASYAAALKAGSLLFAHRTLNDYRFLPHRILVDGHDYVSYDLFNLRMKLQRLLDNPDEIERIRNNGRRAFQEGFSYDKSAYLFIHYLKTQGVL